MKPGESVVSAKTARNSLTLLPPPAKVHSVHSSPAGMSTKPLSVTLKEREQK